MPKHGAMLVIRDKRLLEPKMMHERIKRKRQKISNAFEHEGGKLHGPDVWVPMLGTDHTGYPRIPQVHEHGVDEHRRANYFYYFHNTNMEASSMKILTSSKSVEERKECPKGTEVI